MRLAYAVLLVATGAAAEPTPPPDTAPKTTLGIAAYRGATAGIQFTTGVRVARTAYIDTQLGLGLFVPDARDADVWSAQIGASKVLWTEHSAVGARASLGYQRSEVTYFEALFDDEPYTEYDNMIYGEGALFLRGRLGPNLAIEALVALRVGAHTVGDGSAGTGYASLGLHITI